MKVGVEEYTMGLLSHAKFDLIGRGVGSGKPKIHNLVKAAIFQHFFAPQDEVLQPRAHDRYSLVCKIFC